MQEALKAHLKTGSTTLCRAWLVERGDGVRLGFTDHDGDLTFEGVTYLARSGLTARALQQTTGMSVDNSEALGALSEASVREEDIAAGRFDGAQVTCWQVNWADPAQRVIVFCGSFGEITRAKGAFRVELRGLTEQLNVPSGRVYHAACSAGLGDGQCRVDLSAPGISPSVALLAVEEGRLILPALPEFTQGWFASGRLRILAGAAEGQKATIRRDLIIGDRRVLELWVGFGVMPVAGDLLQLQPGCDKRGSTCRDKFDNFLNFRGFPHIPGEDWLRSNPAIRSRG